MRMFGHHQVAVSTAQLIEQCTDEFMCQSTTTNRRVDVQLVEQDCSVGDSSCISATRCQVEVLSHLEGIETQQRDDLDTMSRPRHAEESILRPGQGD